MNRKAKGSRTENMAKQHLRTEGWLVDSKPWTRYGGKDFYKMFDIVAIREGQTRWIQIKSNMSDFYTARKKIKEWMLDNNLFIVAEIWCHEGRGEWRRERLITNKWQKI